MTTWSERTWTCGRDRTCQNGSRRGQVLPCSARGRDRSSPLPRRRAREVPGTCSGRHRWRTLALLT
jgi:hypothetical protein